MLRFPFFTLIPLLFFRLASSAEDTKPWSPPPPPPDKFDWIELTSGEWLKGEFLGMQDEKLKFDSDKLGTLTIDWEDVKQVRSEKPLAMRFEPDITATGQVRMDGDSIKVLEPKGVEQTFEKDMLVAVASGEKREIDRWNARVSLGANYRSGNTDETEFSTKADLIRSTASDRFKLSYLGRYLETEGLETQNNHTVNTRYDRYLTRRMFVTPAFGQYYRDPFQNFAHRLSLGAGFGYDLIDTSKTEWRIMGGPAYRYTEFDSVTPGSDRSTDGIGAILNSTFETELTDSIDLTIGYTGHVVEKQAGGYGHSAFTTLSFDIGDPLEFDVSLYWDYVGDPQRRDDGTLPENSDLRLQLGLGIEF